VLTTSIVIAWMGRSLLEEGDEASGLAWRAGVWLARWVVPVAIALVIAATALDIVLDRVPEVSG